MEKELIIKIYLIYLAVLTVITFIFYGVDKLKSKLNGWRIREKTLLILSILGGALGGIIAMRLFRHKTSREHRYFSAVNTVGIFIHAVAIICLIAY